MPDYLYNKKIQLLSTFLFAGLIWHIVPLFDLILSLYDDSMLTVLYEKDFSVFWAASRLAINGEFKEIFICEKFISYLSANFDQFPAVKTWLYPPQFLLIILPLGLLEYKYALIIFLLLSSILYYHSCFLFRKEYAPNSSLLIFYLALFGFSVVNIVHTQNGFLMSAILLYGLTLMRQNSILAGLMFSLITVKPQLGILVPFFLVFEKKWNTFFWASFFSIGLFIVSILFFGVDSWILYLTVTQNSISSVLKDWNGLLFNMMPTVFGALKTLGFSYKFSINSQIFLSIFFLAYVLWLFKNSKSRLNRIFYMLTGSILIAPYNLCYDMGAVSVCSSIILGNNNLTSRYSILFLSLTTSLSIITVILSLFKIPISFMIVFVSIFLNEKNWEKENFKNFCQWSP